MRNQVKFSSWISFNIKVKCEQDLKKKITKITAIKLKQVW